MTFSRYVCVPEREVYDERTLTAPTTEHHEGEQVGCKLDPTAQHEVQVFVT